MQRNRDDGNERIEEDFRQANTSLSNREFILLRHIVNDTFHFGFECCRRHHHRHCRHRRFFSLFCSFVCFFCRNCNGDRATFYMNVSSKSSFAVEKKWCFFFVHWNCMVGMFVCDCDLNALLATHWSLVYSQIGIKMNEWIQENGSKERNEWHNHQKKNTLSVCSTDAATFDPQVYEFVAFNQFVLPRVGILSSFYWYFFF